VTEVNPGGMVVQGDRREGAAFTLYNYPGRVYDVMGKKVINKKAL